MNTRKQYNTSYIGEIIKLKADLILLLPMKDEDKRRIDEKFLLEFNYNSNHLEGNTLTYGQTQLLLLYDKSSGDVPVSDLEEMKAHELAHKMIREYALDSERDLTEQFIKELNELILVKPFFKPSITPDGQPSQKLIEIGKYKSSPNSVMQKSGEVHYYASPEETPAEMHGLMNWYNENKDILHPVQLAAEFHYKFVCIHPFDDGNGRVSRLLMNYILYKNEYPPVIIKSDDKESYLTALQKADIGETIAIIEYVEQQMIWSLELSIKAAKGENLEESGDFEKEIELLRRDKLTKSTVYKTPKTSYELIKHIDENLWDNLSKKLNKLVDFFSEISTSRKIDDVKLSETKKVYKNAAELLRSMNSSEEVVIKPHEIFSYDLDEHLINRVIWEVKMLGLKSASSKIDLNVTINLKMNEFNYELDIDYGIRPLPTEGINESNLYHTVRGYKSHLLNLDIQKIISMVSNHVISLIKELE